MLPRTPLEQIDSDPLLSTGARGEFVRRHTTAFYFAATRSAGSGPELPVGEGIAATPFWKSLVDGTTRGWIFLGMMVFGLLLFLLGIGVLLRKGPQGWVEVILGLALLLTPIALTAKTRRNVHQAEERERAARAEEDRRHREILASYTAALDAMRQSATDETIRRVEKERAALTLPYEIWSAYARHAVLVNAMEALARLGTGRATDLDALVTRISRAAGLDEADELGVKLDVYRIALWHLLADDRLGAVEQEELYKLQSALDLHDADLPEEMEAIDQFDRLRGISKTTLPKAAKEVALGFREHVIHTTQGSLMKTVREKSEGKRVAKLVPTEPCTVHVTNRRLIVDGKKRREIALPKIDEVEVDIDLGSLTVRAAKGIKPLDLQIEDPIVTAALIDFAASVDDRPRAFA